MMYVFTGPTLAAGEGRRELDAVFLGPVAQGDVYAVTRKGPVAIGIIDGYFERIPAVWHKEILWAMAQGVHVFGAASMGALRAAELEQFGMEGVGRVFEAFRDGELEDDDEVAIAHGPVESGYLELAEAMVNVRATLGAAAFLDPDAREAVAAAAKALYYRERTWPGILAAAAERGVAAGELAKLEQWLPEGSVNQKKEDALAMLRAMRALGESDPAPKQVRFQFQHTDAWEQVRRAIDRRPLDAGAGADTYLPDAVTDELRLCPRELEEQWMRASVRALALELAAGQAVDKEGIEAVVRRFCAEHGLSTPDDLTGWLAEQQLQPEEWTQLLENEARIDRTLEMTESDVKRHLPAMLRMRGDYRRLADRARDKERVLALHGLENPSLSSAGLTEQGLWEWYFVERLGSSVPSDLGVWARRMRFRSTDALRQAVLREYLYTTRRGAGGG